MDETGEGRRARALAAAWLSRLPRSRGGYAESVLPGWAEAGPPVERTSLAQLRLAHAFLGAGRIGVEGGADAGRAVLDRANEVFWRAELRGWTRSADAEGAALDETLDSYDQAFGLLALSRDAETRGAEGGGGARAEAASRRAREALAGLDEDAPGAGGGYRELRNGLEASKLATVPGGRRQNPHMHLLESFLSWWKVEPEGPWPARAAAMVGLLRARFLDPGGGFLREHFDDDWNQVREGPGSWVEPGHHFEWVWLLNEYRKASGDETVARPAEALFDFASRWGVDGDGLAFDAVESSGAVALGSKLLWPQTERLRALIAWHEWTGDKTALDAARRVIELIDTRYLAARGGLFANRLERDGRPRPGPTPTRVLYHLFGALVEADRIGI